MNLRISGALLLASAALLGGFLAFQQRASLQQLKTEAIDLKAARAAAVKARGKPVSIAVSAEARPALSEAEKLELLRLRGEATRLRQRVRELAGVRAEHEKLRADITNANNGGADFSQGLPPGYVRRREAQFAGFGSPEATLQSMLWAIEQRDTNVLFSAFVANEGGGMQQQFERDGAEEAWKQMRVLPGYRIVGKEQASENHVTLKVEFLPGDPVQEIQAERIGNAWKLRQ